MERHDEPFATKRRVIVSTQPVTGSRDPSRRVRGGADRFATSFHALLLSAALVALAMNQGVAGNSRPKSVRYITR